MVYDFSHFRRSFRAERRVRFCIDRTDFARAVALAHQTSANPFGGWTSAEHGDEARCVEMGVAGARVLVDALGQLGGDAAVSGRMLGDLLDGMAAQFAAARGARVLATA